MGSMDVAELRALLSPEGLGLLEQVGPIDSTVDVVRLVSRLRADGHEPALIAAVLTQARLRSRAVAKFGDFAARMLFTPDGLEQATRLRVAALHAGRFAEAGVDVVADLGCGIGADALAFAALDLGVLAIERDEVTAAIAAYNLAPFSGVRVELGDATRADLTGVGGVWLDPARREQGRRLNDPADWSPALDWAFDLARTLPTGIKLGPGHRPRPAAARRRGAVDLGRSRGRRARPLVRRGRPTRGRTRRPRPRRARHAPSSSRRRTPRMPSRASWDEYLLEPDGAVIRARLIGELARRVDGRMLDPSIAWITTDAAPVTPFGQAFRVLERFPLDVKTLKRELAARGIGRLEIKKRGVDIDPAEFRTRLALKGDRRGDPRAHPGRRRPGRAAGRAGLSTTARERGRGGAPRAPPLP